MPSPRVRFAAALLCALAMAAAAVGCGGGGGEGGDETTGGTPSVDQGGVGIRERGLDFRVGDQARGPARVRQVQARL